MGIVLWNDSRNAHTTSSIEAFSTRCRLAGSDSLMRERIFRDSVRYLQSCQPTVIVA